MSTIELCITDDDGVRRPLITNTIMEALDGTSPNGTVDPSKPTVSVARVNQENIAALTRSEAWRASTTCLHGLTEYLPLDPTSDLGVAITAAVRAAGRQRHAAGQGGDAAIGEAESAA